MKHIYRVLVSGPAGHAQDTIAQKIQQLMGDYIAMGVAKPPRDNPSISAWRDDIEDVVVDKETLPADVPRYGEHEVRHILQKLATQFRPEIDLACDTFSERFDRLVRLAISLNFLPVAARPQKTLIEQRLKTLQGRLKARGVRSLDITWAPAAQGAGFDSRAEGLLDVLEKYLDGQGKEVKVSEASVVRHDSMAEGAAGLPFKFLPKPNFSRVPLLNLNDPSLHEKALGQTDLLQLLSDTTRVLGTRPEFILNRKGSRIPAAVVSHIVLNLQVENQCVVGDIVVTDNKEGELLFDLRRQPEFKLALVLGTYGDNPNGYVRYYLHSTYTPIDDQP